MPMMLLLSVNARVATCSICLTDELRDPFLADHESWHPIRQLDLPSNFIHNAFRLTRLRSQASGINDHLHAPDPIFDGGNV